MRLFTGKQYFKGALILSVLSVLGVVVYNFFYYGGAPFTKEEMQTMMGLPCLIVFMAGCLFVAENTYL